jgi:hypothetical protein
MAPVRAVVIGSREALAGNIKVTPIPIEPPITSRPVLQSHHPLNVIVNATLSHVPASPPVDHKVHWSVVILLIFLVVMFIIILSPRGWRWITGRIWKFSSGWNGPLEEDEEHLLEDPSTPKEDTTVTVLELPPSPRNSMQTVEEWIIANPRTSINSGFMGIGDIVGK